MSETLDRKLQLADAVRATERAKARLATALNNLQCAKADVGHARSTLERLRREEAAIRHKVGKVRKP